MKKILVHPFVSSLFITAAVTLLIHRGWLDFPRDLLYKTAALVQQPAYTVSLKMAGWADVVVSWGELRRTNEELRRENLDLLNQVVQLREIARENELLRQQINLSMPEEGQLVLANIIGWNSSGLSDYFLIDEGTKSGIQEGAIVLAAGNILIGRIIELTSSFAKVQAVTDPSSRINAIIQGTSVSGLAEGGDGEDLILDLVPQGDIIDIDGLVITSGLAGLFPQGLLIGTIKRVVTDDSQMVQAARVKPAVDFTTLRKVFVVNNPAGLADLEGQ